MQMFCFRVMLEVLLSFPVLYRSQSGLPCLFWQLARALVCSDICLSNCDCLLTAQHAKCISWIFRQQKEGSRYLQLLLSFQDLGTFFAQLRAVALKGQSPALHGVAYMQ